MWTMKVLIEDFLDSLLISYKDPSAVMSRVLLPNLGKPSKKKPKIL